jgi:uncharacterized protein (DUF58 family)
MTTMSPPVAAAAPSGASWRRTGFLALAERRLGLTANGVIVATCAVFGLVLGRVFQNRTLLLLVYGVVLVLVLSYVTGRRKLSLTASRSDLPNRLREGQVVDVTLTLSARRSVANLLLEDEVPEPLGSDVVVPVPSLRSGGDVEHSYVLRPTLRGVYHVGPLRAIWSDPFGLTRHRTVLQEPVRMLVHPRIERTQDRVVSREWEDPPLRPPVSRRWPTGFEFYGMREYVAGDDPRRIVWRATAKTMGDDPRETRYLVRESEQGITDQVLLLLDTDEEFHTDGPPSASFEVAVRAAASLGSRHLDDGFSVSLEANSRQLASALRGRRSEIPLLDALAEVELEKVSNTKLVERVLASGRRNAHYVFITPHLSRHSAARLKLMLDRGTSLLLVVVLHEGSDPLSLHRAGGLGCNVVELRAGQSLDRAFRHVAESRGRIGAGRP